MQIQTQDKWKDNVVPHSPNNEIFIVRNIRTIKVQNLVIYKTKYETNFHTPFIN